MAAETKVRTGTTYIILEQFTLPPPSGQSESSIRVPTGIVWKEIGEQDVTGGDRAALRAQFPDGPPLGRKFVATPKRSWRVRSTKEREIENPVVFV